MKVIFLADVKVEFVTNRKSISYKIAFLKVLNTGAKGRYKLSVSDEKKPY